MPPTGMKCSTISLRRLVYHKFVTFLQIRHGDNGLKFQVHRDVPPSVFHEKELNELFQPFSDF